jgi:hypothetical protein
VEKLSKHFNRVPEVCYYQRVCLLLNKYFLKSDDFFEGPFETIEAPLALPFEKHDNT